MNSDLQTISNTMLKLKNISYDIPDNRWKEQINSFFSRDSLAKSVSFFKMILSESQIDIRDKIVIDAGCGLGQNCVLLALFGARKVYGVDIDAERIGFFRETLKQWRKSAKAMERIELLVSDILAFTPEQKGDLLLCNEMLSHLWDRKTFYRKVEGMLSPGGIMFATDGNNGANYRIVTKRKYKWLIAEKPGGRIYESRKLFILDHFPMLRTKNKSIDYLDYLTKGTCYLRPEEIIQNCKEFLETGKLREYRPFITTKAPFDPEYSFLPNEDLLYPEQEIENIRGAGLEPQIIPYFFGGRRPQLLPLNRLLGYFPKISIKWASVMSSL
ncbi:MAG: methyltransferase domain-containing protein [Deltaproteobacteria bacterium]|nr:methyltransferase domain-containing protein [Deltaproteobacteria bacterium]